jgi:hypothetical protein
VSSRQYQNIRAFPIPFFALKGVFPADFDIFGLLNGYISALFADSSEDRAIFGFSAVCRKLTIPQHGSRGKVSKARDMADRRD